MELNVDAIIRTVHSVREEGTCLPKVWWLLLVSQALVHLTPLRVGYSTAVNKRMYFYSLLKNNKSNLHLCGKPLLQLILYHYSLGRVVLFCYEILWTRGNVNFINLDLASITVKSKKRMYNRLTGK